jgi:hypothetical protein
MKEILKNLGIAVVIFTGMLLAMGVILAFLAVMFPAMCALSDHVTLWLK